MMNDNEEHYGPEWHGADRGSDGKFGCLVATVTVLLTIVLIVLAFKI